MKSLEIIINLLRDARAFHGSGHAVRVGSASGYKRPCEAHVTGRTSTKMVPFIILCALDFK